MTVQKNEIRPPIIRTPMDIQAQYFVYKPSKALKGLKKQNAKWDQNLVNANLEI